MNEETRSWEAITTENKYLHEQLDQARITIAKLQQSIIRERVAQMENNPHLKSVDDRTRNYQVQGKE